MNVYWVSLFVSLLVHVFSVLSPTLNASLFVPRPAKAGEKMDYFVEQCMRERHCEWGQLATLLYKGKTMHAVSDGGANPIPGSVGWRELVRQNGVFTWMYGHYDLASNNADGGDSPGRNVGLGLDELKLYEKGHHGMDHELAAERLAEMKRKTFA
jgi:hypothetical protein